MFKPWVALQASTWWSDLYCSLLFCHIVLTVRVLGSRVCVWVMCVSAKAVAALCFTPPCQVIWTSQSMFLFVMRCGAGLGDKSIFPSMFPSSSVTIKYQLHFRLIQVWELRALRTLILFCMIELMHFKLHWPLRDGSKQCKLMVKTTYRFTIQVCSSDNLKGHIY